jgi:hypothetical protein
MSEETLGLGDVWRESYFAERQRPIAPKNHVAMSQGAMPHRAAQYRCRVCMARLAFGALLAITAAPAVLLAQSGEASEGELASYAGAVFGIGSHPTVGATTGTAFSRYAMALIDISYMPLNSETLLSGGLATTYRASGLYDFDLCTNIRIPMRQRWAPYGILGIGLLYNVYQASVIGPAGVSFASRSKTNFEFSTGGGLRYYVRDNWGIRPEVRVFVSSRNFTRIAVGVFYDVGADWPFRFRRHGNARHNGEIRSQH